MPTWEGAILRGNGQTTAKYRDTPRSSVQTRLNRSRCRLDYGLAWSQSIMCYMGIQIPHLKGQFWWMGAPTVNYRHFLPSAVQKRLNRSIYRMGCGLRWAEGCKNSIVSARWRQCAANVPTRCHHLLNSIEQSVYSTAAMRLMSNYFHHLTSLDRPT